MSLTDNGSIKCDGCGRFISIEDLMAERASHHLVTPDAEGFRETFESECEKCTLKTAMGKNHE